MNPWFWAFWGLFIGILIRWIYNLRQDIREWKKLRHTASLSSVWPSVTMDTLALAELRLNVRRLIIDPTDQANWNDVRKLLVGTDFEVLGYIPPGAGRQ